MDSRQDVQCVQMRVYKVIEVEIVKRSYALNYDPQPWLEVKIEQMIRNYNEDVT